MSLVSDLEKQVTAALLSDPRTRDAVIEVIHQYGALTLRGSVDSMETLEAVEEIARLQAPIPVINEMRVQ
jgi:osmotically-inducible protein OsmY